jgi:DnaJ-class molecular chaperone
MTVACEVCGDNIWLADLAEHLVMDHDMPEKAGPTCTRCHGSGEEHRRHWQEAPDDCHRCHGRGWL